MVCAGVTCKITHNTFGHIPLVIGESYCEVQYSMLEVPNPSSGKISGFTTTSAPALGPIQRVQEDLLLVVRWLQCEAEYSPLSRVKLRKYRYLLP
jgi:hypothetical protein